MLSSARPVKHLAKFFVVMDDRALTDPSDSELIQLAQSGQVEAFGTLYRRYVAPIFRFTRSRVSSERDAEDLTEIVFLKAFEGLDSYKERGAPFGAYLYQVARNTIIDHYRTSKPVEPLEGAEQYSDGGAGAERGIIEREAVSKIEKALETLPEHYQEVIRLRLMMDLPTDQVAAWMDKKPATIRVLQHRALKALREALGEIDERT